MSDTQEKAIIFAESTSAKMNGLASKRVTLLMDDCGTPLTSAFNYSFAQFLSDRGAVTVAALSLAGLASATAAFRTCASSSMQRK